jgi:hypothetical protein
MKSGSLISITIAISLALALAMSVPVLAQEATTKEHKAQGTDIVVEITDVLRKYEEIWKSHYPDKPIDDKRWIRYKKQKLARYDAEADHIRRLVP